MGGRAKRYTRASEKVSIVRECMCIFMHEASFKPIGHALS